MISPSGSEQRDWHVFPECLQESGDWYPSTGKLHQVLVDAGWDVSHDAAVIRSPFIQVDKFGNNVTHRCRPNKTSIGVLASRPPALLPDLLVVSRKRRGNAPTEIVRHIPLEHISIHVHRVSPPTLRISSGTKDHYLRLDVPCEEEASTFHLWARLAYLVRVASGKSQHQPCHTTGTRQGAPAIQHGLPPLPCRTAGGKANPRQRAAASGQRPSASGASQLPHEQLSGLLQVKAYPSGKQPGHSGLKGAAGSGAFVPQPPTQKPTGTPRRKVSYHPSGKTLGTEGETTSTRSQGSQTPGTRRHSEERALSKPVMPEPPRKPLVKAQPFRVLRSRKFRMLRKNIYASVRILETIYEEDEEAL